MRPPIINAYLWFSGCNFLRSPQTIARKSIKNAEINRPNLSESLLVKPSKIFLGFLIIFLMLKTVVIPDFIR